MVVTSINFRARAHKRAEILSVVEDLVDHMRSSRGCGRGRLLADSEDPNAFSIVTEWQSAEDADEFLGSNDFRVFRGIRMLLRGEPLIILDQVEARVTRLCR
jgi:quinol monooxygenase YgiN